MAAKKKTAKKVAKKPAKKPAKKAAVKATKVVKSKVKAGKKTSAKKSVKATAKTVQPVTDSTGVVTLKSVDDPGTATQGDPISVKPSLDKETGVITMVPQT